MVPATAIDHDQARGLHDGAAKEDAEQPSGFQVFADLPAAFNFRCMRGALPFCQSAMLPLVGQKLALQDRNAGTSLVGDVAARVGHVLPLSRSCRTGSGHTLLADAGCAIGFSASVQAQRRMLPIMMEIARLYLWRLLPGGKRARFYSVNVMRARHPTWFKEDLERLFGLLATRAIQPGIAERISFDEVADAHRRLEAGGLLMANSSCARTSDRRATASPRRETATASKEGPLALPRFIHRHTLQF